MRRYRLGSIAESDGGTALPTRTKPGERFLDLTDHELNTHILITGTTGGGKSRFLWNLIMEHIRNGRGCCVIEPGDLIEGVLGSLAHRMITTGDRAMLRRLHVVELNPFQLVRYDPFAFTLPPHVHPDFEQVVYRAWQQARVQSHAEVYQRKQNQSTDFEGMPNLQRNFINVFTGVSTLVGGRRLSVADADILIDLHHPDHDRVFQHLAPQLDRDVLADFDVLHAYRNVRDVRNDNGSLNNRVRSTHGLLFKEMISGNGSAPSIGIADIVRRGEILLVKTKKTAYASTDQNGVLAGLMIHDVTEHAFEQRQPFTLIIDEAHKYVRPDIGDTARTARKFNLSLVLATPDLSSLKSPTVDLGRELLNVMNTFISFRMTEPEDAERVARFLYSQNLDHTELLHEVERRAGHEWVPVDEWSESTTRGHSSSRGSGTTTSESASAQTYRGHGASDASSASFDRTGLRTGGTVSHGTTETGGAANGRQESSGESESFTESDTESHGMTISHKLVHLEKIVRESQRTGRLERSVLDQIAAFTQRLCGLPNRHAVVRIREGKAIHIRTLDVADSFHTPATRRRAVEWITRELYRTHDYYFTPILDPEEQRRRVDDFVRDGRARAAEPPLPPDTVEEGTPLL